MTRTDEDGRFELPPIREARELIAVHQDYAPGAVAVTVDDRLGRSNEELVIELVRGPHVYGTVRTDGGAPAPHVYVRVFGADWPRGVSAFTDEKGEYRTGAVHPGPIEVIATPSFGKTQEEVDFSSEWKEVEIGDDDLRVDFGPTVTHVFWHGRVIDELDEPIESGRLQLAARDAPAGTDWSKLREVERSFDGGSFEVGKLLPGVTYRVELRLGEDEPFEVADVHFDLAGRVERDIQLRPGTIHGIVIDGDSGTPPMLGGNVLVQRQGVSGSGVHARFDYTGRFRARGLKPALYSLYAYAPGGYVTGSVEDIRVGGDTPPAPVTIELFRGGELSVELRDFEPGQEAGLEFVSGSSVRHVPRLNVSDDGTYAGTWTLPAATWTVHLRVTARGNAAQEVPLTAGGKGTAVFVAADLAGGGSVAAVEGRMRQIDGAPVVGARMTLYGRLVDLAPGEDPARSATTDDEGRFRIEGLAAGRWSLSATIPAGSQLDFDDVAIEPFGPDPVRLELTVPAGRVRARLVDAKSRAPLGDAGPNWWAFLSEKDGDRSVAQLQGGHVGPSLVIDGVPAGHYQLLVKARGYLDQVSEPFELDDGTDLDVGTIELNPAAVLELDVRSDDGEQLTAFTVRVDGRELYGFLGYPYGSPIRRWDGFVGGTVVVAVEAAGFGSDERSVRLVEGEIRTARFVLERE